VVAAAVNSALPLEPVTLEVLAAADQEVHQQQSELVIVHQPALHKVILEELDILQVPDLALIMLVAVAVVSVQQELILFLANPLVVQVEMVFKF
jgi:hypothetical protein